MIEEIFILKEKMHDMNAELPLPTYFYVGRYGRTLERQEKKICEAMGRKGWLRFQAGSSFYENGLIRSLITEIEKEQEIGKCFSGCIFIEFVEGVEEKQDFSEFLAYIKGKESVYKYVFFMEESEKTEEIKKKLDQYFGIRVIYAQPYETQELVTMLQEWVQEYSFTISQEALEVWEQEMEQYSWKAEQRVQIRLHSIVQNMVYEKILYGMEMDNEITAEDIKICMKHLYAERKNKISLGFCKEEFDYE